MKALILSKNKKLAQFFALEIENFDISVIISERSVSDASQYFFNIIDTDTIKDVPQAPSRFTLFVSADGIFDKAFLGEYLCIKYPIRISELRKIFKNINYFNVEYVQTQSNEDEKICFYDNSSNVVTYNGRSILLSETEMKLLSKLCKAAPNAVSREEIQEIFESREGNAETVYICKLRKKLEGESRKRIIFTVRGEGYRIATDSEWKKK